MNRFIPLSSSFFLSLVLSGVPLCVSAQSATAAAQTAAPAPGIKRTLLLKQDASIAGREIVMAIAEIVPGLAAGKHTHPGDEVGYALEGESVLEIEGQLPLLLKAGMSYMIPAGKIHDVKNPGSTPAKVLAVYTVEKGKPLASPAAN